MAFLKDFKTPSGIDYKNAFWRIMQDQNGLVTDKNEIRANLEIRESEGANRTIGMFVYVCPVDLDGPNYHQQVYNHIKTNEKFSNMVNV